MVFDARRAPLALDGARVRAVADRRTGIGCDQVIALEPPRSDGTHAYMRIWNPDGGEVAACGNGARCAARLLLDESGQDRVVLETDAGPLAACESGDGRVRVDMGSARLDWREIPLASAMDTLHVAVGAGPLADAVAVNMGNPHAVFFVDDAEAVPLDELGPRLETDPLFPERANIGVAQRMTEDRIRLRVWERGAGLTRACGTGACAAAVAGARRGLTGAQRHRRPRRWRIGDPMARGTGHVRDDRRLRRELHGCAAGMSGIEVITLGCRLNAYESEVMRARARAAGLTESVIVNTCAVTGEAERQARQAIRRARRRHPDATIIATGCAAQLDPAGYAAMPEVDRGRRQTGRSSPSKAWHRTPHARIAVGDIMAVRETAGHLVAGYAQRTRAFVQVQNGCDHRCTFCIISLRPRPEPGACRSAPSRRKCRRWSPAATMRWC